MKFSVWGVDVNQFFTREMVGKMRETARPEASKNLHTNLIIEKIAEQESITLTEEEISEKIAEVTKEMNSSEIDQNKLQKFVKNDLLSDKVLTFLQEKNEVELVPEGSLTPEEGEATSEGEVEQVSAE